ncbi:MAG: hypothetical protein JJU36_17430 [Phycisphaeraceae bacterium]|nr:hypothetical protein [Phycisphaeraceae bacterium]
MIRRDISRNFIIQMEASTGLLAIEPPFAGWRGENANRSPRVPALRHRALLIARYRFVAVA